uniref:Annexin n=1 Tax=Myripristis murdjan TaxID=586833 RepID=A0A667XT72_9TELE
MFCHIILICPVSLHRGPHSHSLMTHSNYYGTVTPYPNFCARSDAAALEKAIETKGVDEDVIISILVDRSNEQRQKIKAAYEESTGKPLADALKSALRSHLEDVALALLMTPAQFDAHELTKTRTIQSTWNGPKRMQL